MIPGDSFAMDRTGNAQISLKIDIDTPKLTKVTNQNYTYQLVQ